MRVSVVGGGTAGCEAARGAEARGAEVTVFERREEPYPPWDSWLDQINPSSGGSVRAFGPPRPPQFSTVKDEVESVRPCQITTHAGEVRCDAIILATGSHLDPINIVGRNKQGVIVLDTPDAFAKVGSIAASADSIVICGEGARSLQVAGRLATLGTKSKVAVTRWKDGGPSPAIESVIAMAGRQAGTTIFKGTPRRALGVGKLEAVELNGDVIGCTALVIVPGRHPSVPFTKAVRGPRGGVLVDRCLRSSLPTLFAAGACAEAEGALSLCSTLEAEAVTSGMVAGGNAAGGERRILPTRVRDDLFFDLRWSRAGARFPRCGSATSLLGIASHAWGSSGCTLVFQKGTGRVVGIETVDLVREKTGDIGSLISEGKTLDSLAYGGSTDISLISETARRGLRLWSRS